MDDMLRSWIEKHITYLKDKRFLASLAISLLLLVASIIAIFFAVGYATESSTNFTTDIILSHIRVYDVDGIFLYGPIFFWAVVVAYALWKPHKIPFMVDNIAVFLLVRSVFISLTHIGPFPTHIVIDPESLMGELMSGNDLFFSGHTGFPYLMALVFWDNKFLRYFSLASSVLFGAVVLMGHLHYTVDVLGAFFITYTIYHIVARIFKKDHALFLETH